MNVTLKLFASLAPCLPAGAVKNQSEVEGEDGLTVSGLLDRFNVPRESCHLVLLNGVFQAPDIRASVRLSEGDVVAVWPPVAGG